MLALTCDIELFTQAHYRSSIDPDPELSEVWKDVFLYHWREESQRALLDELEWKREDARLSPEGRDQAVDDLIALVAAVDGILVHQAGADADYFLAICGRALDAQQEARLRATLLAAYRYQYIATGVSDHRFLEILGGMINADQHQRITAALGPILAACA